MCDHVTEIFQKHTWGKFEEYKLSEISTTSTLDCKQQQSLLSLMIKEIISPLLSFVVSESVNVVSPDQPGKTAAQRILCCFHHINITES